jgi:cyanate permease
LDHKSAAIGFALVKTGGAVGGFAGPFVLGALADAFNGYTVAMLLLAGVAVAAAGLVLVFNDHRH